MVVAEPPGWSCRAKKKKMLKKAWQHHLRLTCGYRSVKPRSEKAGRAARERNSRGAGGEMWRWKRERSEITDVEKSKAVYL